MLGGQNKKGVTGKKILAAYVGGKGRVSSSMLKAAYLRSDRVYNAMNGVKTKKKKKRR